MVTAGSVGGDRVVMEKVPAPAAPDNSLPVTVEPPEIERELPASMFPFQTVPEPMTTSLPTINQMFLAVAPLISLISVGFAIIPESLKEVVTLMMKTGFASLLPSNVATKPAARLSTFSV